MQLQPLHPPRFTVILPPQRDNYVNVYRDSEGKLHYSTEEFSIHQEGLFTFDDALEEAYRYCVAGLKDAEGWQYVQTLCNGEPMTDKMLNCLGVLEIAKAILGEFGEEAACYDHKELVDVAKDIVDSKGRR